MNTLLRPALPAPCARCPLALFADRGHAGSLVADSAAAAAESGATPSTQPNGERL